MKYAPYSLKAKHKTGKMVVILASGVTIFEVIILATTVLRSGLFIFE